MNANVTIDLTQDDSSDCDSCLAEVAAYISSTPASLPSKQEIVDLTVSPTPYIRSRTETTKSSTILTNRITDFFSPSGPLSPTKKIKTEHGNNKGWDSIILDNVKEEPGSSSYSNTTNSTTPFSLGNSSTVPTEQLVCRSTSTSTQSYQTAADSEEMMLANRLAVPDYLSPSSSFHSANQSIDVISPQSRMATSAVISSRVSSAESVDDTSYAMEIDCSVDMPPQTEKMSVVTPKVPSELTQPHAKSECRADAGAPVMPIMLLPHSSAHPVQTHSVADELNGVFSEPVSVSVPAVDRAAESVTVPCGVQINNILHSLRAVVDPLAHLVGTGRIKSDSAKVAGINSLKDSRSQTSSLTAASLPAPCHVTSSSTSSSALNRFVNKDTAKKKPLTEPAKADDAMLIKKLKYIDKILFPSLHSDTKPAELSQNGEVLHIVEQALRNNFNSPGVMKRIERALQSDGPVCVYLMLIETKLDVLKHRNRRKSARISDYKEQGEPQVFGLGSLPSLLALLSRLFHLPAKNTQSDEADTSYNSYNNPLPRSNHSSGEKSLRGESSSNNNNTTNNHNSNTTTVGIVAKSSQRQAKISKKASTYTTTTNNPAKDFATSDDLDVSTLNNSSSGTTNNSTAVRPGVRIINTNNPTIRTEMDSLRVLAEEDSAECAVGLRILHVWCEYMQCVRAHCCRGDPQTDCAPLSTAAITSTTRLTVECIITTLRALHVFASEVRDSTSISTLINGARRNVNDLDTLAEADAKRAAVLIEELAANAFEVFATQCLIDNALSDKENHDSSKDRNMNVDVENGGGEALLHREGNASDRVFDVLYEVLDLENKLKSPAKWVSEQDDPEEDVQYEKYLQTLLNKGVSLCDAALRPWSSNTGGTVAVTAATVYCTASQSRGVIVVRYLLAQLKCILARMAQHLEDLSVRGVMLSELPDTPALRKITTNLDRILKLFLNRVKIVLFCRNATSDQGSRDVAEEVQKYDESALHSTVELLLQEHKKGNSSSNKKRTVENRLVDIIDHLASLKL